MQFLQSLSYLKDNVLSFHFLYLSIWWEYDKKRNGSLLKCIRSRKIVMLYKIFTVQKRIINNQDVKPKGTFKLFFIKLCKVIPLS